MNKLRRIVNNTLISLLGQFVTWTSTLVLTIAYGRFLGDVKFGVLYFAISFVALVGFPVELGFNQQLTRDVAEDPEKSHTYLWNTLLIKVTLWAVLYCVLQLLAWVLGYDPEQRSIVAICGITLLSGSIVNTFAALHYAFERTFYPAVGMMLEKGLSAIVGFILLKYGATVQTMAFVLLGGSLIDAIWVSFWFFRLTGRCFNINKATLRKLVRTSIPFLIYGVLGVIYYRIDTVLLSLMTNDAVVGWYGAGYRLFDTLLFIPNLILNAVMYPVFSKLSVNSRSTLKMAVEKCLNLLLICSIPIATLMIAAAPNIIGFLYHRAEFENTIPVIQALAPGLVFLYINTLLSSVIVSTRGERKIPIMAAAALVFNLGLNLFLIPLYRQVGAAVVTTLTELLLLCISSSFVPKYLLPGKSMIVAGKAIMAAIVMALVVFFLQTWSILAILPIALLVYGCVILILKTVPREDVQALYEAIKHKGDRSSTKTLKNIADENIDTQITERLPIVKANTFRPLRGDVLVAGGEMKPETGSEEDATTERSPSVRAKGI
jgi:O-antigen/teichoic acid export membrane protein